MNLDRNILIVMAVAFVVLGAIALYAVDTVN